MPSYDKLKNVFKKKCTLVTSFFTTFFILILGMLINLFRFNIADLTEIEKCPACYGISMCQIVHNNNINFHLTDFYSNVINLFGVKNVYYGNYNNKRVVMKKLASRLELAAFDEIVCSFTDMIESCSHNKNDNVNFSELILSELSNSDFTDPNVKVRLCPTIEKTNDLFQNVKAWKIADSEHLQYLWTLLKVNPEPIILEILSVNDNWPTPKYFGACGRLIIEEYIGHPLSAFEAEPWIKRAKIASSLLAAAHLLTFKNIEFAFYLTDISMDNIAVNENNEAIFVDLENVIIVDKNPPQKVLSKLDSWNEMYANNIDIGCRNCFVFSPSDICEHKVSDHNYYAICQHVLTQNSGSETNSLGLLHNPPKYILDKYPMFKNLLKQCSIPNGSYSRIDSGIKLKQLLDTIIKDVKSYG